ncbi:hypothetical protein N9496_06425 [Akkermansiaceae bacterium]|nr:hypothetical protein [Akkermansiaceae bacterium]
MDKNIWRVIGIILYGVAFLDFALSIFGYDITGFSWTPVLFGALGYCCFFYIKDPVLADGEKLLILGNGKQANATVGITKDLEGKKIGSEESHHKLFLTDQTLQIDGEEVKINWPYSMIQSISQDTHMKMNTALRLVTHDNQDLKFNFGVQRKKRDLFMAAIQEKLSEASAVGAPSSDATVPPPLPDGRSEQTG